MSERQRPGLLAVGLTVAAAGAAAAVGVALEKLVEHRRVEDALDSHEDYRSIASREVVVIAADGVPLHVEIDDPEGEPVLDADGRPVTVVFTHGYTHNLGCWVFQRRALRAAGYRLVLWDQRAHGKSGTGDVGSYSLDQLGRDLHTVIDQTTPEGDLALVGHSMGGMTMIALAEQDPQLVRDRCLAAAFVATSPGGLPVALGGLRGAVARTFVLRVGSPLLGKVGKRRDLVESVLRGARGAQVTITDRFSFGSPVPSSVAELTTDMIFATPLDVMTEFVAAFDGYDKRAALAAFAGAQVLVFNGDKDILTPPAHSDLIVEGIPGAEHVVLEDAGHVIMLEHPDVLSSLLIDLLQRGRTAADQARDRSSTGAAAAPARPANVRRRVTDIAKRNEVDKARRATKRRHHA